MIITFHTHIGGYGMGLQHILKKVKYMETVELGLIKYEIGAFYGLLY